MVTLTNLFELVVLKSLVYIQGHVAVCAVVYVSQSFVESSQISRELVKEQYPELSTPSTAWVQAEASTEESTVVDGSI